MRAHTHTSTHTHTHTHTQTERLTLERALTVPLEKTKAEWIVNSRCRSRGLVNIEDRAHGAITPGASAIVVFSLSLPLYFIRENGVTSRDSACACHDDDDCLYIGDAGKYDFPLCLCARVKI